MEKEGWTTKESMRKQRNQQNGSQIQAVVDKSWGVFVVNSHGQSDDQSDDLKVLLLEHNKTDPFWSFSKGHKDKNLDKSDVATAIRELEEETNLVVCKLWKETETWEEYCAAERNDLEVDPGAFRTFVEEYSYNTKSGVKVSKTVTFFVAKSLASSPLFATDKTEIKGYKWVNLDSEQYLTAITFGADKKLFKTIKDAILGREADDASHDQAGGVTLGETRDVPAETSDTSTHTSSG